MKLARHFGIWTLSLGLALPPGPAYAEMMAGTAPTLTPEVMQRASEARASGAVYLARLRPAIEKLKVMEKPVGTVAEIANSVLQVQAMIIMLGSVAAQTARERREFERLAGGHALPANGAAATPDIPGQCGTQSNAGVLGQVLCSGEFYLGAFAAAGLMTANWAGGKFLSFMFQSTKTGGALMTVATSVLIMGGAQSAAFLWSQAVKLLPRADMIARAPGIAGRRAVASLTGVKAVRDFDASPDGEVYHAILKNMYDIVLVDHKLRDDWIYNTWRFGMARGEFVSAMGVIMAASAAGTAASSVVGLGGTVALATGSFTLASALGVAAPVAGFIVCAALGMEAMNLVVEHGAPQAITRALQSARETLDVGAWNANRSALVHVANFGFKIHNPVADSVSEYYRGKAEMRLTQIASARTDAANVLIEKFYELMSEERTLRAKIEQAEFTVRHQELQNNLFVKVDGTIVSYAEAKQQSCTSWFTSCDISVAYQLQTLDALKPQLLQAEKTLADLAFNLQNLYDQDYHLVKDALLCNPELETLPVTASLHHFAVRSMLLRDVLIQDLSGANDGVAKSFGVVYGTQPDPKTGKSENDMATAVALQDLSTDYTQAFDEDDLYASLAQARPLDLETNDDLKQEYGACPERKQ